MSLDYVPHISFDFHASLLTSLLRGLALIHVTISTLT